VHLHGGPGGAGLIFSSWFSTSVFSEAREKRDIILLDQRSSGASTPSLACPEILDETLDLLRSIQDANGSTLDELDSSSSLIACRDRLQQNNVDLASYTTIENAADLNDLRLALGIEQWNLYGVSYGGTLAQTIMRYYPEGVRSVVLDSSDSPATSVLDVTETVSNYRLLSEVITACSNDFDCNKRYPDFESRFWEKVFTLAEEPDNVDFKIDTYGIDIKGTLFDDAEFIKYANYFLLNNKAEFLPHFITRIFIGDYSHAIAVFEQNLQPSFVSIGSFFSMICADEKKQAYRADSMDNVISSNRFEVYRGIWLEMYNVINEACDIWPHSLDKGILPEPVHSTIPTLIFGGKYDMRTPVEAVRRIGGTLINSTYVEFPNQGHGVFQNECSQKIRDEFISFPSRVGVLDTRCVDDIDETLNFYIVEE